MIERLRRLSLSTKLCLLILVLALGGLLTGVSALTSSTRQTLEAEALDELRAAIVYTRSLTELRIMLTEGFSAIGFESARLKIRTYDGSAVGGPATSNSVGISFPLHSQGMKLGTLELSWGLKSGVWPFDARIFAAEFLPVLVSKLEGFGHVYRESPREVAAAKTSIPEILPSLAAEANATAHLSRNV